MYNIIKAMGPMPLPCTTPLCKCATDDSDVPTRVWWVLSAVTKVILYNTLHTGQIEQLDG